MKKIKVNAELYIGDDKLATVKDINDNIDNSVQDYMKKNPSQSCSPYVKEYDNEIILTNHDEPIYLKSNTRYSGHGTVFKTTSTAKHHVADVMTNPHPESGGVRPWTENIIIEGFIFDGDSENVPGDIMTHVIMLAIYQCRNVTIRNCIFRNSKGAYIICHTCSDILIEDCHFYGGDSCINGDSMSYKENITIRNCYFDGELNGKYTVSESITMKGAKNVKIESNYIMNKQATCCAMAVRCDTVKMINNTFRSLGAVLCGVRECTNVDISNNTLYGDDYEKCYYGIGVCDSQGVVSNNKIYDVRHSSIYVNSTALLGNSEHTVETDILLRDNIMENAVNPDAWTNPILIQGWGRIRIIRNELYKYVSNHWSIVSIRDFTNPTDGDVECNISIINNIFDDTVNIVGFADALSSRDDIKINLDVRANIGNLSYKNLLDRGYTPYICELKQVTN